MSATPYSQSDQVFVVMRGDPASDHAQTVEASVVLLKALWSQAAAEAEVARLNQTRNEHGQVYFWKAARLERHAVPQA